MFARVRVFSLVVFMKKSCSTECPNIGIEKPYSRWWSAIGPLLCTTTSRTAFHFPSPRTISTPIQNRRVEHLSRKQYVKASHGCPCGPGGLEVQACAPRRVRTFAKIWSYKPTDSLSSLQHSVFWSNVSGYVLGEHQRCLHTACSLSTSRCAALAPHIRRCKASRKRS